MITVFYGMSGALKTTTINNKAKNQKNTKVIRSSIKTWKDLYNDLFKSYMGSGDNNLNYALLHLCSLDQLTRDEQEYDNVLVERGVSDPIFYQMMECKSARDEDRLLAPTPVDFFDAMKAVKKELELLSKLSTNIEKRLLIMEDDDFIVDRVLKEPHRAEIFKSLEDYKKYQDLYVDFTKSINQIPETNIVRIKDAQTYITKILNLDFD